MVERLLAKEKVVSSNLIARSVKAGQQVGFFAEIAQSVEHSTENAGVPSSSLGLGTILIVNGRCLIVNCARSRALTINRLQLTINH